MEHERQAGMARSEMVVRLIQRNRNGIGILARGLSVPTSKVDGREDGRRKK